MQPMQYFNRRFGIKDCVYVVGLLFVTIGVVTILFEILSRLQLGKWDLVSIATVMDIFGIPPVRPLLGEGELQKSLEPVVNAVFDAPFSITSFLIGSVLAILADHSICADLRKIDRRYPPSLPYEFGAGESE
jgi:hypothetical protein